MPSVSKKHSASHNKKKTSQVHPKRNEETFCSICNMHFGNKIGFEKHRDEDKQHLINFLLLQLQKHWKRIIKDRHGIAIKTFNEKDAVIPDERGAVKVTISPATKSITLKFSLENTGKEPCIFSGALLLHPYPAFTLINDIENLKNINNNKSLIRIHKGCKYEVCINFSNPGRGTYGVPVAFQFFPDINRVEERFEIHRILVIKVQGHLYPGPESEDTNPSPFRGDNWNVKYCVPGVDRDGQTLRKPTAFPIPPKLVRSLRNWLGSREKQIDVPHGIVDENQKPVTDEEEQMPDVKDPVLQQMRDIILRGYGQLEKHYKFFFQTLLHLDEFDGIFQLQRYNMRAVKFEVLENTNRFELEVPGLAEKRPSLLKGDLIYCRFHVENGLPDKVEYEGEIVEVRSTTIVITHFDPEFTNRMIQGTPLVDVRFTFSRYPISVCHTAVHRIVQKKLLGIVFPTLQKQFPPLIALSNLEHFNKEVGNNSQQKEAVLNILKANCRPAPYIIFGPPGTGKTVTIVEAILQVKKLISKSRILVCAPSNAACDTVASRMIKFVKPSEMIRVHSSSRDWSLVPNCLHPYSNHSNNKYFQPKPKELATYKIVVCTLIRSNKLLDKDDWDSADPLFTHIFIDECGQAMEPESLIPIGAGLVDANLSWPKGVIVLAGDPRQLGPCCNSRRAENVAGPLYSEQDVGENDLERLNRRMGLGVSLLERLMTTCGIYQKGRSGHYNSKYITKLLLNFRSHSDILKIPNELFYSGELIPNCPSSISNDPVCTKLLSGKGRLMKKCTIIFHGVIGQEKREGHSPSYFNRYETDQVLHYVGKLLDKSKDIPVKQSDIGIIAPYIRQVYKIKNALSSKKWSEVEVGTTETFQGREKRVIIISTVRSNCNLMDYDFNFRLGFVADPKRFNVAVTRAQSLLIIVGNPYQLIHNSYWKSLLTFCAEQSSYAGSIYMPRDQIWWDHVGKTLDKLNVND